MNVLLVNWQLKKVINQTYFWLLKFKLSKIKMNQLLSPQEQGHFAGITFSNLKAFGSLTPMLASPPIHGSRTSRKKHKAVRSPTEIIQISHQKNNILDKNAKKTFVPQTKDIKFPRLELRKLQKQKRNFSTVCLNRSTVDQQEAKAEQKDKIFRQLFLNKPKSGLQNNYELPKNQKKTEHTNKPKFNSYMKLFPNKKAKEEQKMI